MAARKWLAALAAPLAGLALFMGVASILDPRLSFRHAKLSAADEGAIRSALSDYNKAYEDFFASEGNPLLIDVFPAAPDVKHHVFRDIGFVRSAGLVQVQDLAETAVRDLRATGPAEAEALVYEEWNYMLQRSGSREPASQLKGAGQGFRYWLRKEGGRWLVVRWDVEDVAAPPRREDFTW